MKLILQSLLCSYLLATVASSLDSAKPEISSEVKKRLNVWLQKRVRRDSNSVSSLRRTESGQFVRPEDVKDTLIPHSSPDINVRSKRSKNSVNQSKRPGCSLGTCTVHDLAHRVHMFNNKFKTGHAPLEKISPHGYGRRRRSLHRPKAALRLEGRRLRRF